jgi:hypothetical protein
MISDDDLYELEEEDRLNVYYGRRDINGKKRNKTSKKVFNKNEKVNNL